MPTPSRALATIGAVAVILTACGSAEEAPTISDPAYLAFRDQPTACGAEQPEPAREMQFDQPEDMGLTGPVEVVLETSCGDLTLTVYPEIAPVTVNSFVFLVDQGYFDGIALHRVVPGYIVQMGDPTAAGGGSPGYRLPDELPPLDFFYRRGMVAMANRGPDTGGSQFFVMIEDAGLPPSYAVFGQVTAGFETLVTMTTDVPLGMGAIDSQPSKPLETIYIERAYVGG